MWGKFNSAHNCTSRKALIYYCCTDLQLFIDSCCVLLVFCVGVIMEFATNVLTFEGVIYYYG